MKSLKVYNQPKQYKRGWTEFYKLKFRVTPDTLIPRPETELLVDEVLTFSQGKNNITILDLGTGSGNIAISIAKNLSHTGCVTIIATDISPKALKVAKQNAHFHNVSDRILFVKSNLLSNIIFSRSKKFDVIVTNLPYIPTQRIPYLNPSVKDFEPHLALDGGEDGFELYRKLFTQIKERDWNPKLIVGEIDYTHGELAVREVQKYFPEAQVEIKTDLFHKQRILKITQPGVLIK